MSNYSNIKYFSTQNGSGVRTCVFFSGCRHHCNGCFNQIAWDFKYGNEFTQEVIDRVLTSIEPEYIAGLSILGGEPLVEENLDAVDNLINQFREKFGDTKNIWMWSGYQVSEMTDKQRSIALKCDFVVDGRFDISKHEPGLVFKGSSNQIIWHIKDGEFIDSAL